MQHYLSIYLENSILLKIVAFILFFLLWPSTKSGLQISFKWLTKNLFTICMIILTNTQTYECRLLIARNRFFLRFMCIVPIINYYTSCTFLQRSELFIEFLFLLTFFPSLLVFLFQSYFDIGNLISHLLTVISSKLVSPR